jgi:hypothetical protein
LITGRLSFLKLCDNRGFVWRWIHDGGAFQALSILFGAAFTIATCTAMGAVTFGRALKHWPERFVTGAAILNLTVFALCCAHLVYPVVFLLIGSTFLYLWLRHYAPNRVSLHKSHYLLFLPFAAFFLLYFLNAMVPEASPDGAAYHLGFVARYLREHGFRPITWNIYASFSEGTEMLFLFAFAFGKHSAAALVHLAFLTALAWQMILYARRAGFERLGMCAALLVFAAPVVGKDATSAYNDAALACAAVTLFSLLQVWDEERASKLLLPIGLIAGFCYAIKFTGGVAVLYALGFVAWKIRKGRELRRPLLTIAGAAAIVALPWMAKNLLWVHNPVSPFFNSVFPNQYVTSSFEADYRRYYSRYELSSLWQIPLAVTVKGQLIGVLGPVFLLAPLALLALRRREGRQLLLAAAVFGSTYFANIGTRFLIPPLPFLAMAMVLGLGSKLLAQSLALAHAVISWPAIVTRYTLPGAWNLEELPWKYALRLKPEADYLRRHLPQYGIDELIERTTEPGASIFTFHAIPEAYTSRRILVEYESASNHMSAATLWTGFLRGWQPTWRMGFSFPPQMLQAIRIQQRTSAPGQWRINELRAFHGSAELPRDRWIATAGPFPWGIARALDGNPVTLWECGDALRAGSYVEARFASPETLDSVLMESAPNQRDLKLELLGQWPGGDWKQLAAEPDVFTGNAPDLRRAAIEELKRQGIGYLLLFSDDDRARPVQDAGEAAGITAIGASDGAVLYKLQ